MQKRRFNLVGLLLILVASVLLVKLGTYTGYGTVGNTLQVNNLPPNFTTTIPNQSWYSFQTVQFDLDDYFTDLNEQLAYNSTGNRSINVTIDQITGTVNFSQAETFSGTEYVIFSGIDTDNLMARSNNVTLTVSKDNVSPLWASPAKNKSTVTQNDLILFTTTWTDNHKLGYFIFSIKTGSSFVNQSPVNFTAQTNTSSYEYTITNAPNETVEWKFIAFDATGNMNATPNQNFTLGVPSPPSAPPSAPQAPSPPSPTVRPVERLRELLRIREIQRRPPVFPIYNFTVEPAILKVELKQGETVTRGIKLTNTGNQNLTLSITIADVSEFAKISVTRVEIPVGESKGLVIDLSAKEDTPPDIYLGKVFFQHETGFTRILPVVMQVNKLNLIYTIDTIVTDYSKRVEAGDLVFSNITIRRTADSKEVAMSLEYTIKDLDGNTIDTNNEQFAITETKILGKDLKTFSETLPGDYIFYGRIVYLNETAISGDLFKVVTAYRIPAKVININLLIIAAIIVILLISTAIMKYSLLKRKAKMLRLYFLISQAYRLIREGKIDNAKIYLIKIKKLYEEKLDPAKLADNEFVKNEVTKIYKQLTGELPPEIVEVKPEEHKKEQPQEQPKTEQKPEVKPEQKQEAPSQQEKPKEEKPQDQKPLGPEKKAEPKKEKPKVERKQTKKKK